MQRISRRSLLAGSTSGIALMRGFGGGFIGIGAGTSSSCAITSVLLNGNSSTGTVLSGSSGATVGTLTSTTTGSCGADSWTKSGTDAASFTITGAVVTAASSLSPGTYSVNFIDTIAGATGSGATHAFTITAAASTTLATLTVNNVSGSAMPASAFWEFGQPFGDGDVPTGSIVTATLNGTSVPLQAIARSTHGSGAASSGSLKWGLLQADLSGVAISAGSSQALVLSSTAGSWSSTTGRTNADWTGLVDTVELTNLTTTGTSSSTMNKAGTWIAAFDNGASNTLETVGTSPLGLRVKVYANFVNTGTTHRYLRAYMEYWVTQLAGGGLGPIASFGPMIDNTRMLVTSGTDTPSQFTYDINWKRNGASQRSITGIPGIAGTLLPFCRGDGQYDWTASEPVVVVTRDITELRKTKKVPPFISGLTTYSFSTEGQISSLGATMTMINTGVANPLWGSQNTTNPVAVSFRTTGAFPTGIVSGTTYWAAFLSSTTFSFYDTLAHAVSAGATGKVTPSGGSGTLFVRLDTAPTSPGPLCQGLEAAGNRPDISIFTEWAVAPLFAASVSVAAAQAAQRMARATAMAMSGVPYHYLDNTTNKIISLLPTAQTPAGMQGAADYSAAYWTGSLYSSVINGGSGPTGSQNGWDANTTYGNSSHIPSPIYLTWLLEGKIYFRDLLFNLGNRAIVGAGGAYGPQMNYVDSAVGSGTTYYRNWILDSGESIRACAWSMRDVANAAMAASDGSDERTYFVQSLRDNLDLYAAFRTYKSTNYSNLGIFYYDTGDWPASTHNLAPSVVEGFMAVYYVNAAQFAAMLHTDNASVGTDLNTCANNWATWLINFYNQWGFASTGYSINPRTTAMGQATTGAAYASGVANVGQGPGSNIFFSYSGTTITWSGVDPWWTLAVGDKFQPTNWFSLDTASGSTPSCADPPASLTIGTIYTILTVNVGAKTFTLNNGSGSPISFATSPSNLGGFLLPSGQSFASTGYISDANGAGGADGYGAHVISGLGMAAVRGVSGASAAFTSANNRYVLGTPLAYNTEAMWYMQSSV